MVVIQQEETRGRVSHGDRRKRAAAKKRMKSGKKGGWQTLSKDDREFLAAVFKEYDVDGTGTMVRAREPTPLGKIARFATRVNWLTSPPPSFVLSLPPPGDVDQGAAQVTPLLQKLAGGEMPTEEEVKEVLDLADNDKSGAVSIDELKDVIRIWYTMCKAKPKKGGVFASCCVM